MLKFCPPHLLFYVKDLGTKAGEANGPVVRIKKGYENDLGIHAHEALHVKHWYCSLGLSPLLYLLVKRFRLWAEVQCYKVQLKHHPVSLRDSYRWIFARFISTRYNLNTTVEEAYRRLGQ